MFLDYYTNKQNTLEIYMLSNHLIITWLIMPPKEAVLLKMLVLLISMNIELAIIATTPPLSPALFQLNMDSSMLT